jgi:flavin reductase (DIM6/NTAB) family NADH-FMN oxidoreductase RutF
MEIAAASLSPADAYKLMIGIVVPRPIAWVTSINGHGLVNAAPFSAYTFCGKNPPMVCFNVGRRDEAFKDTAANVRASGEFVVNSVTVAAVEPMHETSAEYPAHRSEVEAVGLELLPSKLVKPPRIVLSPIHLECKLERIVQLGRDRDELIIGEVVYFHVRDELIKDGKVSTEALDPLARLGGPRYATLGRYITMAFTSGFGEQNQKRAS